MSADSEPDDVVRALTDAAGKNPDVGTLCGFVGPGDEDGLLRLYPDATLRCWMNIRCDDVVHRERVEPERGTLGGRSVLWIKGEVMRAPLCELTEEESAAAFLRGPANADGPILETFADAAERITVHSAHAAARMIVYPSKRTSKTKCC